MPPQFASPLAALGLSETLAVGDVAAMPQVQHLLDQLPIGVALLQVGADGQILCRVANSSFDQLLGTPRYRNIGLPLSALPGLGLSSSFSRAVYDCVCQRQPGPVEVDLGGSDHPRQLACHFAPVTGADGTVTQLLVAVIDCTVERQQELALRHAAYRDRLTELPNRDAFLDQVSRAAARCAIDPQREAVVMILNVDRFAVINESLGHAAGDDLLRMITRRIQATLGAGDVLARFHGDEYAILIDEAASIEDGHALANRIHRAFQTPFRLCGHDVFSSVSIGIASARLSSPHAEDIVRDADFAMHRAKTVGKARTEQYHSGLHRRARHLFQLEADLRRAIKQDEFQLAFQPLVRLADSQLMGFEALLRWPTEAGYVSPADFIPLAEETGLVVPIGRWVLDAASQQMRHWQLRFGACAQPLVMGINVSGVQFARDDVVSAVRASLMGARLEPGALKLELTETALVENPERTRTTLTSLKELGIGIALDDFGTGYSSLSYLQRFPIDVLKVDRSFVANMLTSDDNYKIVQAIISLAHALGMAAVAEGIEQPEQSVVLAGLGCALGQGFHYSRPMAVADAETWIARHSLVA
jgi:diguanylate cyclase (GGDEF)-like protein